MVPMPYRKAQLSLAILLGAAFVSAGASGQDASPQFPEAGYNAGAFRFDGDARSSLQELWANSIAAKEERVGCIGGYRREGVAIITRVRLLVPEGADSSNVLAARSLTDCRPPNWFGTVHTHIAKFQGLPYVTFSAPDRNVIMLWHERWKIDGVFCVLYSDSAAHCESGTDASGDTTYSTSTAVKPGTQRGNTNAHRRRSAPWTLPTPAGSHKPRQHEAQTTEEGPRMG